MKDKKAIFVVPNELKLGRNTKWLVEKGVFNKEELYGMIKLVEQEMKVRPNVFPPK